MNRLTENNGTMPLSPHNRDAERALLSVILQRNERLADVLPIIRPHDFYTVGHQVIYRGMIALSDAGQAIDFIGLGAWLTERNLLVEAGGNGYLVELWDASPGTSTTSVRGHAELVRDAAQKRMLRDLGRRLQEQAERPGADTNELLADAEMLLGELREGGGNPAARYCFTPITSAEFAAGDYRPQWLVKNLLVRGQPAIVGGPKKAMKTSILIDLALSLGTGTPFLGTFTVYRKLRVALVSGESGEHTLQETALRICAARGIGLSAADVLWQFTLPQLANIRDMGELKRGLQAMQIDVLIIDPLYLCLLVGSADAPQASNLFEIGPLLLSIAKTCLSVGCTPILIHHARKNLSDANEPLELEDLAFAGIQEFARQWLLLSRRDAYEPGSGRHRLWLSAGGSIGHGGVWGLDIDEGQLAEDFTGRKWEVTVVRATEARELAAQEGDGKKAERKERQDKADDAGMLAGLDQLFERQTAKSPKKKGKKMAPFAERFPTKTEIRVEAGLPHDRATRALNRLLDAGIIEPVTVQIKTGTSGKVTREVTGYRRRQPTEKTEKTNGDLSFQAHSE